jgi:hypothetical protein
MAKRAGQAGERPARLNRPARSTRPRRPLVWKDCVYLSPLYSSTFHFFMLFVPYKFGVWGYCCEGSTLRMAAYQSW